MRVAVASETMTQIHQFDFRGTRWIEVTETLSEFRMMVDAECSYAYIKTAPGLQQSMVERLVSDLNLEDHVCTEPVTAREHSAIRYDSKPPLPANHAPGSAGLWSRSVTQPVARGC